MGAFARTLRAVRRAYPNLEGLPGSLDLRGSLDRLAGLGRAPSPEILGAVLGDLRADISTAGVLDVLAGVNLVDLGRQLRAEPAQAAGVRDRLREGLATAARKLAAEERTALADLVAEELSGLGYRVERAQADGRSGLWAAQEDRVMAVLVIDGGAVEIDVAGCEGSACRPEVLRLLRALQRRGLEVGPLRSQLHADRAGGNLIRRAGGSAAGLVGDGSNPTPARQQQRQAARPRLRAGGSR
jgi:hypothetical protein